MYDDRLLYMTRLDALSLDESLGAGEVFRAWVVWSSAAETALDHALKEASSWEGYCSDACRSSGWS